MSLAELVVRQAHELGTPLPQARERRGVDLGSATALPDTHFLGMGAERSPGRRGRAGASRNARGSRRTGRDRRRAAFPLPPAIPTHLWWQRDRRCVVRPAASPRPDRSRRAGRHSSRPKASKATSRKAPGRAVIRWPAGSQAPAARRRRGRQGADVQVGQGLEALLAQLIVEERARAAASRMAIAFCGSRNRNGTLGSAATQARGRRPRPSGPSRASPRRHARARSPLACRGVALGRGELDPALARLLEPARQPLDRRERRRLRSGRKLGWLGGTSRMVSREEPDR